MGNKKRVCCISDLIDGLTKDKVYEVESFYNTKQGLVFYCIIDDYGKLVTCDSLHFMDTKQVVINGGENYSELLTPYWLVELFKRKGRELYLYEEKDDLSDSWYQLTEPNNYNSFQEIYSIMFSFKKLDKIVYDEDYINLISRWDILDDISREDKDLIDIAREINDESIIKIVDIPANVDYYVKKYECDFGEYIVEKHREWF